MYVRVCAAPGAHKNAFGHIRIAFHVCAVRFARVLMYVRVCMCACWAQKCFVCADEVIYLRFVAYWV